MGESRALQYRLDEYVIMLNLPTKAPESKISQLKSAILHNVIHKINPDLTPEDIEIPLAEDDGKKHCSGIGFLHCKNAQTARQIIQRGDMGYIDKNTRIKLLDRVSFDKYLSKQDVPQKIEVNPIDQKIGPQHFSWFMRDERLLDQIVFMTNKLPSAVWFNHSSAQLEDIELPHYIQAVDDFRFTPDGRFLVTVSNSKLHFFCGENWIHMNTIEFPGMKDFLFSTKFPTRYVLIKTKNNEYDNNNNPTGAVVYDLLEGRRAQPIPLNSSDYDKLCFGANDVICMGSGRELKLVRIPTKESPSLKIKTICEDADYFSASTVQPLIMTFRKEHEAAPPRISFISSKDCKQIDQYNAYGAVTAETIWHPKLAMCAVLLHITQKKKGQQEKTSLRIYDLRQKGVKKFHIEDIKGVVSCAWDPVSPPRDSGKSGTEQPAIQLAVIALASDHSRQLQLYEIKDDLQCVMKHMTSGGRIQYSPAGRFVVVDDIEHNASIVQFYDMHHGLIRPLEMEGVESIQWDPSGVFVMTSSSRSYVGASGFSIWLLDGNPVVKNIRQNFKKSIWRPKPIIDIEQADIDALDPNEVKEAKERYGRFGVVNAEIRLEEEIQQKKIKLQRWINFMSQKDTSYRASKNDVYKFEIQLEKPQENAQQES